MSHVRADVIVDHLEVAEGQRRGSHPAGRVCKVFGRSVLECFEGVQLLRKNRAADGGGQEPHLLSLRLGECFLDGWQKSVIGSDGQRSTQVLMRNFRIDQPPSVRKTPAMVRPYGSKRFWSDSRPTVVPG